MGEMTPLHKAYILITKLKKLLNEQYNKRLEPIAIIGISGRFPNADNKDEFWKLLYEGQNIVTPFPEERWQQLSGTEEAVLRNTNHPYWGGFLNKIDQFDAYFFGVSPREAIMMDPQQRLLLEVIYEAFEDAGIPTESLAGSNTGIFASLYASQYGRMQQLENDLDALYIPTGNAVSIAANRLSYLYDLRGPSLVFDTACSSTLVATHIACLNLQNKLCDLAVVCGANINLLPSTNELLTKAKMLSPTGQCKTFDADANGYVPGEGIGAIILRPLSDAIKNNDRIYSLIIGSAINQDGKTNGLTAPNGLQQEKLLGKAYKTAKISPRDIAYIECHGTGTFLGDPIEAEALGKVVSENRDANSPCLIGSLKTNIGHLEPAAGVASLIKVALSLKNNLIPAQLGFSTPNPHIDFEKYKLKVVTTAQPWPSNVNQYAGVSGFGFGGTNAHIVLQNFISEKKEIAGRDKELFTLSAKNNESLQALIIKWHDYLSSHPNLNFNQICYSTHVRRSHYPIRLAIIADNMQQLLESLLSLSKDCHYQADNIFLTDQETQASLEKIHLEKDIDLKVLADHYIKNANIDWIEYESGRSYPHLDMPTYAWQHKSYWPVFKTVKQSTYSHKPLEAKQLSTPLTDYLFEFNIKYEALPELKDTYHIMHVGYYLEILASICKHLGYEPNFQVENLHFLHAVIIPPTQEINLQVILKKVDEKSWEFSVHSQVNNHAWTKNAEGQLVIQKIIFSKDDDLEKILKRCTQKHPAEDLYERVLSMGMPAGDSIRWTQQYWTNGHELLCEFKVPETCKNSNNFVLNVHPGIFDAAIQPIFELLPKTIINPYMAHSFSKIKISTLKNEPYYLHVKLDEITKNNKVLGSSRVINAEGQLVIEFENLLLAPLDKKIELNKLLPGETSILSELAEVAEKDRHSFIVNFLKNQVSIIFSIPKEDINSHSSLREMGIDSLMGLVLLKTLETHFSLNYAMESLLAGPSVEELAEYILKHCQISVSNLPSQVHPPSETNWIAYREAKKQPKFRLFCFPYGGGSASIFRDWQKALPSYIEVCPIQYPGRENRLNEKPIANLNQLIEILVKELSEYLDLPFAFFGHSMGGLIAYELSCKLRELNRQQPNQLYISAFPDPRLPTKGLNRLVKQLEKNRIKISNIDNSKSIEKLSDQQLIVLSRSFAENGLTDYKDYLLNKEISKILLPIFVNDMKMIREYEYTPKTPLKLPITVFLSKNDPWIPYEDHLSWADHTSIKCDIIEYNHGHLFIKDKQIKKNILHKIEESIKKSNNDKLS